MAKYHISPITGNPNQCHATKRPCPIGGEQEHFSSKEEAREAFEQKQEQGVAPTQKKSTPRRDLIEQANEDRAWWDARKNVAGLEIRNSDGDVEAFVSMSRDELEMPGYLETVERGYEATEWTAVRRELTDADRAARANEEAIEDRDPHCFVCNRHTDHFAEHDGLVDAGLASYGEDGTVRRTDAWDDAKAKEIAEQEYRAYMAEVAQDFKSSSH